VQDWLCQTWVPIEERMRRKREIFGLPPEDEEANARTAAPKTEPAPDRDDDPEAPGSSPDQPAPAAQDPKPRTPDPKTGSSPVKVSQGIGSQRAAGPGPSTPDEPNPADSPARDKLGDA